MIPFFPFSMISLHPLMFVTMQGNPIAPACNITLGNPPVTGEYEGIRSG